MDPNEEKKKKKEPGTPDTGDETKKDDSTDSGETQEPEEQTGTDGQGQEPGAEGETGTPGEKEQDAAKTDSGDVSDPAAGEGTQNPPAGDGNGSLDELLQEPELKAAFDAKVQEAVTEALKMQSEADEAARIAGMTPEERSEYEADKREKELAEREKALMVREMKATAAEELQKEQLPAVLAECFNYESQETYEQTREAVVKAFQDAMKEAVNARLRGNPPRTNPDGAGTGSGRVRATSFSDIIKENKVKR